MNNRIRNLTKTLTVAEVQTLLATLYLAVDDASLTDVSKLLWQTLLENIIIRESNNNTTIAHKAMTPKAFFDTKMTTSDYGIGKVAADDDILNGEVSNDCISVYRIPILETRIKKDFFTVNGAPVIFVKSEDVLAAGGAIAWQAAWKGNLPTSTVPGIQISPNLDSGATLYMGYCMVVVTSDSHSYSGVVAVPYSGSEQNISLGDWFSLVVPVARTTMHVRTRTVNGINVRFSITANFTVS